MTCALCIATWSLNTHQIWSQSAKPFLSYSVAANFYIPSLCTCHVRQCLPRWIGVGSMRSIRGVATHQRRPFVDRTRGCRGCVDPWLSKASRVRVVSCRAGHTQICSLFTKEPRSALRAPLIITVAYNSAFSRDAFLQCLIKEGFVVLCLKIHRTGGDW